MRDHDSDFSFEAMPGLPEQLPRGEQLIWQGSPSWSEVARRVYHVDKIALYFIGIFAWRVTSAGADGVTFLPALHSAAWIVLPAALAVGLFSLLAWGTARTTIYTITSERVVLRFGMALPLTINIPFSKILSADLATRKDGSGDIVLTLIAGERIAYAVLWPHLGTWSFLQPRPAFRCVPDARRLAALLGVALSISVRDIKTNRLPQKSSANIVAGAAAGLVRGGQLTAAE